MPTAFGRAMLDSINGPAKYFRLAMQAGPTISMNCRDFLNTREDENRLLDGIELPDEGSVLDWGCGVGRHLYRVRRNHPSVHCCGIDICDLMLDYCRRTIAAPSEFATTFEALQPRRFDLVLLMGNGLGVLGHEEEAVARLRALVNALTTTGRIVIETGNPFGRGYCTPDFTIDYDDLRDGPFPWGYSDREWISRTLGDLGCEVMIQPSQAVGGMFFFAVGKRGEQGGAGNAASRRARPFTF